MSSNEYMRDYMLRRYHKRRNEAIERLGGVCVICGSPENLEFDHVDPTTKSFTIASSWSASQERFDAEIAKCQLLCEACHRHKHRTFNPHGTAQRYWQGCRCRPCTDSNTEHNRLYKAGKDTT
jgi:hypothetical protein